MAKWNWLKSLRCLAGVGATLMAGSVAMAADANPIADAANPDRVFSQTSYNLAGDVCGSDCGPGCGHECDAGCQSDGCYGCEDGDMFGLRCDQEEFDIFEGLEAGGWVQVGYTSEKTLFNNSDGQADEFHLNQGWLFLERAAESHNGEWDWGYRGDFVYGIDGPNTQSFGNNPGQFDLDEGFTHGNYGWAIPQLYVEATNGDTSIKAGHFYTLHGYEVVTAPDNFFFTHAYSMNNSEPFTHTGVVVTQAVGDDTEVYAGWTAGWDTGFDQFTRLGNNGSNFLGGASTSLTDDLTMTYILSVGDFGAIGDGYGHSVVLDWQVNERLNYVFHHDLLNANQNDNDVVAVNQYLIYQLTDCVGVGGRTQWWKNDGISVYGITGGLNIKPHSQVIIRPEVRYDWSPAGTVAARDGVGGAALAGGSNETTFGIDFILTF